MNRLLICVAVLSMACAGAVQAASITVDNYSFESPDQGKVLGWNGDVDPSDIPGWVGEDGCSNSGIENPERPSGDPGNLDYAGTDGLYAGLLGHVDPGAWNLTGHTIAAGEEFTLTVDATNTYTSPDRDPLFKVTLYYDDAGTRVEAVSQTFTLPTTSGDIEWGTYSVAFAAADVSASIGKDIGIELANVTPVEVGDPSWGASWMIMDDVRLEVIPEPSTMMLLGLGLLALLIRRRV